MNLPDGVRGIIPYSDIVQRRSERTGTLAAGGVEEFFVETAVGEVWKTIVIAFWTGAIAGSTGNHVLDISGIRTLLTPSVRIPMIRLEVVGTAELAFHNCPQMLPASIISRIPESSEASIALITGHYIGREIGVNNQLRIRYTNNTNMGQASMRRFVFLGLNSLDIVI